jgi:multicomponent Na+:H+ antiporter subunit G
MTIMELVACFFIILGVLFSFLGVVGILRLPDTYTRLHASGKTGTLGVAFLCVGAGILMPASALKLIALGLFITFSGPVASHAIAAAVHRSDLVRNIDLESQRKTSEEVLES